jgi:hypothetical protein
MCLLRLADDILVFSLKLIQVILGQITMLLDSPFQAPSPLPIPFVYDRIKYLIPLGICQLGGDERPWILLGQRHGLQFVSIFLLKLCSSSLAHSMHISLMKGSKWGIHCDRWSLRTHTTVCNRTSVCLQTHTAVYNRTAGWAREGGSEGWRGRAQPRQQASWANLKCKVRHPRSQCLARIGPGKHCISQRNRKAS